MTTGRAVDAAVAKAMGMEVRNDRLLTHVWVRPTDHWIEFGVSTDDATALTHCVPWLRQLGRVHVTFAEHPPVAVTLMRDEQPKLRREADTFAAALCQVVLAVAGGE